MALDSKPTEHDPEDSEEFDEEAYVDPGLRPHEYVVGRINIRQTLGSAFYFHAHQRKTPGTFPIDSDEAVAACWALVTEFLAEYEFPKADFDGLNTTSLSVEEWECPRFIPRLHMMFIKRVYGGHPSYGWRAEIQEVEVECPGVPIEDSRNVFERDIPAYTSVYPTPSPRSGYDSIVTQPLLLPQYAVYQNIYISHGCSIGSVPDGIRTVIHPDSAVNLKTLKRLAKEEVKKSYLPDGRWFSSDGPPSRSDCGCSKSDREKHPLSKEVAFADFDDVVVDFSRSTEEIVPGTNNVAKLSFYAEINRTRRLINDWITWIMCR
jgi:hypothetical protein